MEPVRGIGGSTIAALSGTSPWSDEMDAYLDIFGLKPYEESTPAYWGNKLEPVVAREYAERNNVILFPSNDEGFDREKPFKHPDFPWWWGTPDRLVVDVPGLTMADLENDLSFWQHVLGGLECKTAGYRMIHRWGKDGGDDIPESYYVQCVWYRALLNLRWWDCAVLIGGQDYRQYRIRPQEELEGTLLRIAEHFWTEHVLERTPPRPSGSDSWKVFLNAVYPTNTDNELVERPELAKDISDLEMGERMLEICQLDYARMVNGIKAHIGNGLGLFGYLPDGRRYKITWKNNKSSEKTDWEEAFKILAKSCNEQLVEEAETKATRTFPGPRVFRKNFDWQEKKKKKEAK